MKEDSLGMIYVYLGRGANYLSCFLPKYSSVLLVVTVSTHLLTYETRLSGIRFVTRILSFLFTRWNNIWCPSVTPEQRLTRVISYTVLIMSECSLFTRPEQPLSDTGDLLCFYRSVSLIISSL